MLFFLTIFSGLVGAIVIEFDPARTYQGQTISIYTFGNDDIYRTDPNFLPWVRSQITGLPSELTYTSDPVQPEPVQPTEPVQPEPVQPTDTTEPPEPAQPCEPTKTPTPTPTEPTEPPKPTEPTEPPKPSQPSQTTKYRKTVTKHVATVTVCRKPPTTRDPDEVAWAKASRTSPLALAIVAALALL